MNPKYPRSIEIWRDLLIWFNDKESSIYEMSFKVKPRSGALKEVKAMAKRSGFKIKVYRNGSKIVVQKIYESAK
jgi:hypothetical protein